MGGGELKLLPGEAREAKGTMEMNTSNPADSSEKLVEVKSGDDDCQGSYQTRLRASGSQASSHATTLECGQEGHLGTPS